jgi:hypothetical protein
VESRLDAALGYTFPSDSVPTIARLSIVSRSNALKIQFGKLADSTFFEPSICENGWWIIEKEQSNEYVGDGATLDYLKRRVELAMAADGGLIVHLIIESQFSSFIFLTDHEIEKIWAKFDRVARED